MSLQEVDLVEVGIDAKEAINVLDEISKFIFTSKYARYLESEGRRETWDEAVTRVENMHLKKFRGDKLTSEQRAKIRWAFDLVRETRVLPSMRTFQFGGIGVESANARAYNCSVRHIDSIRSFAEVFYLLLCGCGVGLGLTQKYLKRLPDLVSASDKTGTVITYVVEDTIEGWADSLEALLLCYTKGNPYSGRRVVMDYSRIRRKGSKLKTGGGKAPGYKPLRAAHGRIKKLLDALCEERFQPRMKSVDVYDVLMHAADAVLSGGVRRSATSVIFDKDDMDMLNAKVGTWYKGNPQRARSNNSVLLIRNEVSLEEFKAIGQRTREWGEPGFVFGDSYTSLYNPCFSLDTRILTDAGWRSFGELLGTTPTIMQDKRFVGSERNGREVWTETKEKGGTTWATPVTNVRLTATQQPIYKLTTFGGREVRATGDHHIATPAGMVKLEDLQVDDKVLVGVNDSYHLVDRETYDVRLGFLAGLVYGNGCFAPTRLDPSSVNVDMWCHPGKEEDYKEIQSMVQDVLSETTVHLGKKGGQTISLAPEFHLAKGDLGAVDKYRLCSAALFQVFESVGFTNKTSLKWLHYQNKEMKAGFMSGFFYADGHIEGNKWSKTVSIRFGQSNFEVLQDIQLILQELGTMSRIYDLLPEGTSYLPDGKGGYADYHTKRSYRISCGGKEGIERILDWLIFFSADRMNLDRFIDISYDGTLDRLPRIGTRYTDRVISVEEDGVEDVYCLSEDLHRTLIANGVVARRCFEIGFSPVTEDGVCGVQFCNLSSINGAKIKDEKDFLECAEAAAIIGTLQATYADFPYLSKAAEQLTKEEALLGVSITAILEQPKILLDPVIQQKAARVAVDTNKHWAEILGINQAARVTTTKPEGTLSLTVGTMASGIHAAHAHWMFRRIQMNKMDNIYNHFKQSNPHMCEPSSHSANGTDDVVTFPVRVPDHALVKNDLDALTHLDMIKSTQENWVMPGTTEANKKNIRHSVSCTVIVQDTEWETVFEYLYQNRSFFSAVSLIGATGDKDYAQAPNEAVVTAEDFERFEYYLDNMVPVDYTLMREWEDETSPQAEVACAGGACLV